MKKTMTKLETKRTIVVEGRYDAVKLNAITNANIITLDGFAIYSDKENQTMLKRLAAQHGLILLLDSDGAGFRMRHYVTGLVGADNVLQVYTPAVQGKEKRKATAGKEGLLGVEGIDTPLLYKLLQDALAHDTTRDALGAGSAVDGTETAANCPPARAVTHTDLFRWGLSGTAGSAARKTAFLQSLGLPPRLSKNEIIKVLNSLYTYEELEEKQKAMFG